MFSCIFIFLTLALGANTIENLNIFADDGLKPRNLENLSPSCQLHYNLSSELTLAIMFDASVKIPNGIGYLNFYHLGDFDECFNLEQQTQNDTIYGKYCLGIIPMFSSSNFAHTVKIDTNQLEPRTMGADQSTGGLHLGYCIPSGCTAEDLHEILSVVSFDEKYCESKKTEEDLTPGGIATVSIVSIFMGIVALSTIFETVLYYMKKKTPHEIFIAFSALSNGRKIISASTNPDQLLCLNGIKAISMMWVLTGHMYSLSNYLPIGSYASVINFTNSTANMFVMGGSVSVDTFFTIGGIVTVYAFLKSADKGVKFNIFLYYFHRYLRLTPAFAVVIALQATVIDKISNGPLWYPVKADLVKPCQDYWWPAILYIQNYFTLDNKPTCVTQSWYLSVDFQLFLLSPLVLLPLKRRPKIGVILLGILILAGVIVPFTIGYVYKLPAYLLSSNTDMEASAEMTRIYYTQPYTRFGPYVIGMLAGYFIYRYKKDRTDLNLHPILCLSIWGISIAGLIACVYSYHDEMNTYDRWSHSLAIAFLRNGWAVSVCAVVYMCISGYGGVIDWFLSLPVFQFLTKLSYSMYLVHYSIIVMLNASQRYNVPFSNLHLLWSFWGHFMFTLGVAIILTLTFESPIIILEKYLFRIGKSTKFEKNREETELPAKISSKEELC